MVAAATGGAQSIMGANKVARFFLGIAGKNAHHDICIEPAMINGTLGALLYMDGELDHV